MNRVILDVAARYGISTEELCGRDRAHTMARVDAAYLMRREGASTPRIGGRLGGRDHSTILHLLKKTPSEWAKNRKPYGVCLVDGCDGPARSLGMCPVHYARHRRGTLQLSEPPRRVRHRRSPDPIPGIRHGLSGYRTYGCGCGVCREANRKAVARRRVAGRLSADPAPVRAHVEGLYELGMTRREVAAAAGVGEQTIWRLMAGRTVRMRPETAAALLAVAPPCRGCGGVTLGGGRWCGVGRCAVVESRGWSWSQRSAA